MEELYRIANNYYMRFESIQAYGSYKEIHLYVIFVMLLLFVCALYLLFFDFISMENPSLLNKWFVITIASEVSMFLSMMRLNEKKNKKITALVGEEFGKNFKSVNDAKIELLKGYFICDQVGFSKTADIIHGMLNRECELSKHKTNIEKVFAFIYEKEAKSRILTLFVLLCSIITILSVGTGKDLNAVISSYSGMGIDAGSVVYMWILFIVLIVGFGISLVFMATKKSVTFVSLLFLKESTKNIETVKYLIRDLNNYHVFTKTSDNK